MRSVWHVLFPISTGPCWIAVESFEHACHVSHGSLLDGAYPCQLRLNACERWCRAFVSLVLSMLVLVFQLRRLVLFRVPLECGIDLFPVARRALVQSVVRCRGRGRGRPLLVLFYVQWRPFVVYHHHQ